MSEWKVVSEAEAKEGCLYLAWVSGTVLPSYQLVGKRKGTWRFEEKSLLNGRRVFPKQWIGTLWELPSP